MRRSSNGRRRGCWSPSAGEGGAEQGEKCISKSLLSAESLGDARGGARCAGRSARPPREGGRGRCRLEGPGRRGRCRRAVAGRPAAPAAEVDRQLDHLGLLSDVAGSPGRDRVLNPPAPLGRGGAAAPGFPDHLAFLARRSWTVIGRRRRGGARCSPRPTPDGWWPCRRYRVGRRRRRWK